jgi:hypothetical protein
MLRAYFLCYFDCLGVVLRPFCFDFVRQFELIYNKRNKEFKNNIARENAWQAIACNDLNILLFPPNIRTCAKR